jgi:hypothetical protein
MMEPVSAGDYTLVGAIEEPSASAIHSSCIGLPNGGFDVCRFIEGAPITASWRVVVPSGKRVKSSQIIVTFGGFRKSYAPTDGVADIPFADIFGDSVWSKDKDGEVHALAVLEWEDDRGIVKTANAMAIARILVLSDKYAVLPMNSGLEIIDAEIRCHIQYTTNGRSAVRCERD